MPLYSWVQERTNAGLGQGLRSEVGLGFRFGLGQDKGWDWIWAEVKVEIGQKAWSRMGIRNSLGFRGGSEIAISHQFLSPARVVLDEGCHVVDFVAEDDPHARLAARVRSHLGLAEHGQLTFLWKARQKKQRFPSNVCVKRQRLPGSDADKRS
eukprot:6175927-Pleurochrysis_carterae.AAC.3